MHASSQRVMRFVLDNATIPGDFDMRRLTAVLVAFCIAASSTSIFASAADASDATTVDEGRFVPVTYSRLYSSTSAGSAQATPTTPRTFPATGVAGIPASGVAAIVVDINARSLDGNTYVYARTNATDDTTSILNVGSDTSYHANTVIVKPNSAGKITVATSFEAIDFNVDVQGYFTNVGSASSGGGFVPITPTRLVDSSTGKCFDGPLSAGTTYTTQIAGQAGIPTDATAVFANVRISTASTNGAYRIVPSGTTAPSTMNTGSYATGRYNDTGQTIKLGPDGKVDVSVTTGTVNIIIDVQGYFTAGVGGGSFTPLDSNDVYTTVVNQQRLALVRIEKSRLSARGKSLRTSLSTLSRCPFSQ